MTFTCKLHLKNVNAFNYTILLTIWYYKVNKIQINPEFYN